MKKKSNGLGFQGAQTAHAVVVGQPAHIGLRGFARGLGHLAAAGKGTPRRQSRQIGRGAGNGLQALTLGQGPIGAALQQGPGIGVARLAQQGAGAVVNISSTSGIRWTGSAQVAYAATKAAVIQLGRVVAVQYAKQGIRVNTVVPGQLHTPMVDVRLAKQRTGGDVQTLLTQRQARIPLPFMGDGQDTANAVLFLASDEARFITGTEIIVDGGMSARCD